MYSSVDCVMRSEHPRSSYIVYYIGSRSAACNQCVFAACSSASRIIWCCCRVCGVAVTRSPAYMARTKPRNPGLRFNGARTMQWQMRTAGERCATTTTKAEGSIVYWLEIRSGWSGVARHQCLSGTRWQMVGMRGFGFWGLQRKGNVTIVRNINI